ncbi:MAG: hypothetical protein J5863_06745 [Desulfovibrio sp.]|nr:hypothetical protein [Desulfovibrio sp.]
MTSQLSSASRIQPASILPCAVPLASAPDVAAPASCARTSLLESAAVLASAAVVGVCLAAVITVSICWHGLYLEARENALDSTLDRGFEPAVLELAAPAGLTQAARGAAVARGA